MIDCLSEKMLRLSDEMANLAAEIDGKYHMNAIELAGAAMIMKDWALAVKEDEACEAIKSDKSVASLPELSVYDR